MKLEFVETPKETVHVINNQYGQTALSHCFICNIPIEHSKNTYRHICNGCRNTHGHNVLEIWRAARKQFPDLEEA